MDKKARLLEIIQEIQELYPHLDRLMITDIDEPDSIIITSEENILEMAEAHGIPVEFIDDFFDEPEELELLDFFDDEDDDDGGVLQ